MHVLVLQMWCKFYVHFVFSFIYKMELVYGGIHGEKGLLVQQISHNNNTLRTYPHRLREIEALDPCIH